MPLVRYIFFVLILFPFQKVHAQESLVAFHHDNGTNAKFPFLSDYFYEEVTFGKTERNTDFYHLKGPVKTITETKYNVEDDTINSIEYTAELTFNLAKQIMYLKHIPRDSTYTIEEHVYKNHKLSERITKKKEYSDSFMIDYRYNNLGYLMETEKHYNGRFPDNNDSYHYKIEYTYNDSYTIVHYQYIPITRLFSELMEEGEYKFHFDEKGNVNRAFDIVYDSLNRPVHYFIKNNCGFDLGLCVFVTTEFDERGNIIEQIVEDETVRDHLLSYNSYFKARYDENNLIIWKESNYKLNHFTGEDMLLLNNTTLTHYEYTFDEYGNWTKLKVYIEDKNIGNILSKIIERNIEYYDGE